MRKNYLMKSISIVLMLLIIMFSCDQSANMFLGVGQAIDSESPKISITSPENGIYVNKSNITITGKCSDNVGVTRIRAEAGINEIAFTVTEEIKFSSVRSSFWSVTFDADKLDRVLNLWRSGLKVTFTFTCYDAAGNTVVEHLFLYVDVELPTVIINRPEVRFTENEKIEYENNPESFKTEYDINKFEKVNSFVNKEFTIKGYVDDDYSVKSTYINIYNATKKKQIAVTPIIFKDGTYITGGNGGSDENDGVIGNSQSWEFKLDSTLICPTEGWCAIEVVTEDEAGNEKKQFVDKYWMYVNQAADIPRNNFTSFSPGFKLNAGNVIAGNGFDDDGMKEVWIKIVPESEANAEIPYTDWKEDDTDASHIIKKCADFTSEAQLGNWSLNIPSKAGNYVIYAIPVDINNVAPQTPYEGIYASYFSVASEEDPVIGIDSQFRGSTIVEGTNITGYFYDNSKVTKITVKMDFDGQEEVIEKELYDFSKSKDENKIQIYKEDNTFQLVTGQTVVKNFFDWKFDTKEYPTFKVLQMTFRSEDEDGNYGEDAITIYGDSERPVFIGDVSPANNSNILKENVFTGTVSDNVDVVSVTIKADGSAWKEDVICNLGEAKKVDGKTVRTFTSRAILPTEFGGWADREFTVTATDTSGNTSVQIITLKGDKTKPVVKFVDEDGNEEESGNYVTKDKILNVRITPAKFEDGTYREIKSVTYSTGTQSATPLSINKTGDDYTAQIKVADLGNISGDVTLQVTAIDDEKNDGLGTNYFIVDNEEPNELAITSPLLSNKSYITGLTSSVNDINENEISYYQNEKMLLKGAVSDNYKINKTCLSICKIDSDTAECEITLDYDQNGKIQVSVTGNKAAGLVVKHSGIPGNFTLELDTTKLDDGNYALHTTSYDAAGNSKSWGNEDADEYYFKVLQDADKPRITFNIDFNEDSAQIFPGTKLKGSVIDDDCVKDSGLKYILSTSIKTEEAAKEEFAKQDSAEVKVLPVRKFTRSDWELKSFQTVGEYYLYMIAEDINGKESEMYKRKISVISTSGPFIKSISTEKGNNGAEANGYYSADVRIKVSATGGSANLKYMYYRLTSANNSGAVSEETEEHSGTADSFRLPNNAALGKWHKFEFSTLQTDKDDIIFEFDSKMFAAGKTDTINVEVKCENDNENAGDRFSVAVKDKIAIDNQAPTLKITVPSDNADVNKEIEIGGSVNDIGVGVKKVYVSYKTDVPADLKEADIIGNLAGTATKDKWCELTLNGVSWEGKFDTTTIHNQSNTLIHNLTVAAVDLFGNVTIVKKPIKINQDGDRPIVMVQNLTLPTAYDKEVWCDSSVIYGAISDDDGGNGIEVYVSEDGGTNWSNENLYKNGSWSYTFKGDGKKTLAFKVKDSVGTEFKSSVDNGDLTTVKVTDLMYAFGGEIKQLDGKNYADFKPHTQFKINVDTKNPTIEKHYYSLVPNPETNRIDNGIVNTALWSDSFSGKIFGGKENIIWLLLECTDDNGIANIALTGTNPNNPGDTDDSGVKISFPSIIPADNCPTKAFYKYEVDISKITSNLLTLWVKVSDNSGRYITDNFTVNIDNISPIVSINSHTDGSKVYGTENNIIKGSAADSNAVATVEYALTKTNNAPTSGYLTVENPTNWEIKFENNDILNNKVANVYGVTVDQLTKEAYDLYLWVKATDRYGNESLPKSLKLTVLPHGDKPRVVIEYPEKDSVLGGKITISGTTDILTNSVKEVYVQIDPSYDDSFSANWESELMALDGGYTVETDSNVSSIKGIKVTSSSKINWRLNINEDKKLEGIIAIKAIAVSSSGKYTESDIVVFRIDKDVPEFTEIQLVKYDGTTVLKTLEYKDDIWISGSGWMFECNIEDRDSINENSIKTDNLALYPVEKKSITAQNYRVKVPLNTNNFGKIEFNIEAEDNATPDSHSNSLNVVINYDNTPPEFSQGTSESNKLSQDNENRTIIENNSAGVYTIEGEFSEESNYDSNQSGFERIAMYFTRTLDSKTYIIDPMLQKGNDGKVNRYLVSDFEQRGGMYWREVTVSTVNDSEITLSAVPENVRPGGLCEIGGVVYRIENVVGNNIIVEGSPSTADKAYFAVAQVIDNLTMENGKTTFYTDNNNSIGYDDGDHMVEGVARIGTSYEWMVSVNSENIFDGNTDIHFVAFDKAGNYTERTYYTKVTNNTPRIAGVTFGSDINGNDSIDDNELIKSYANSYVADADDKEIGVTVNGKDGSKKVTDLKLPLEGSASLMTIKGDTKITAKIVGGNNGLQWKWRVGDKAWFDLQDLAAGSSYNDNIRELPMSISMLDLLKAEVGNSDDTATLQIKIIDKTENGGQEATINIRVKSLLQDTTAPTVEIKPFYWNSESDNSLYQNSRTNGHIELTEDLTDKTGALLGADDPKVSGKITIGGTANDNVRVDKLIAKIPGFKGGTEFIIATRNNDNSWTFIDNMETEGWACEIVSESFDKDIGNIVNWKFHWDTAKIENVVAKNVNVQIKAADRGKATLDSNKTKVIYGDQKSSDFVIYKMDVVPYITSIETPNRVESGLKNNNIRAASGKYSVIKGDIDNFITVKGFNLNVTAVRIVASGNIADATVNSGIGLNYSDVAVDYTSFILSNNSEKSGYLELFAKGIRALNNINNNDSCGTFKPTGIGGTFSVQDYRNMPNREPDYYQTKNVLLNDDRYLRFFDMKDTGIKNGYYPTMIMEGNDPVFGYVNLKGGPNPERNDGIQGPLDDGGAGKYFDSHAMAQRAKVTKDGSRVYTEYLIKASNWDQMGMARDDAGRFHHVSLYNRDGASMSYIYDRYAELYEEGKGWGSGIGYSGYDGSWSDEWNNNAITLENMNYGNGLLLGRYQYPKIIAKGNSVTDQAVIYMMYYDAGTTNKELILRNFKVGTPPSDTTGWNPLFETGKVLGTENCVGSDGKGFNQYANTNDNRRYGSEISSNLDERKIVATGASNSFAFGVTSDNHVVFVYYDDFSGKLVLKYSAEVIDGSNPKNDNIFVNQKINFPDYVGTYVSMAIDEKDGIHISAFDSKDSNLTYINLASYNATTYKAVTIDQASAVGNWTQIKIKNGIPYIAYYNATEAGGRDAIKLAYANTEKVSAGVDEDGYTTGAWEYMTVPAITSPQGGKTEFQNVCLDFDSAGLPVVGYLGSNIEFGKWLTE